MANILIIGGAGFIGSNLVKSLINCHNVYIYDIPNANTARLESYLDRIFIYHGQLSQYDYLCNILEENSIDIVIHLVSGLLPCSNIDSYLEEYSTVIYPTIKLLPYLSKKKVKFIFFSSGGTIYGLNHSLHIKETEKSSPICYYGLSKQVLEDSVHFEHRFSGLEYLIIRPSNPYGPGQNVYGKQGLIAVSIGKILNHEKITIWGDGSVVRDYIYIDDLSYAMAELIRLNVKNETFNIGSGIGHSVNEIIQEIQSVVDDDFEVEYSSGRNVDLPFLVLNISKLKTAIRLSPISIKKGIKQFKNYQTGNNE